MKRILAIGLFFTFFGVSAQGEFLNKSNSLSGTGISTPNPSGGIAKPSVFNPKPATPGATKSKPIDEKPINFATTQFGHAGESVQKKLNKTEKDYNPDFVKRDMFFGEFKTKSDYVRICYRDFQALDGDVVSIYTPDMILLPNGILDGECQYIKLSLLKGENKITLLALNQGQSGDNTGELTIYDDQNNILTSNQWYLAQGFKASVIIYKER